VERLGRQKDTEKPSLYYELIPAEHYKTYMNKCDFTSELAIEQEAIPADSVIKSNPKPVILDLPKLPQPDDETVLEALIEEKVGASMDTGKVNNETQTAE